LNFCFSGDPPDVRRQNQLKTKTINSAELTAFAALLREKQITAAAAAAASRAAKIAAEALGLPSESVLLKADDKSSEILALWSERSVSAIAARVDSFHSFKPVKGANQ
jgi:hypothetical protein